ncbi:F-box domain-containing protein [Colletotrichum musicola]|uniref:F-box domain-containing protein n=1 Tax=Colletotrichum musicola TaxID=2175873 RepID=A0A8H6JE04_9PEZI|nr:F-box domain-containing protein [Colletotrichum musicola]
MDAMHDEMDLEHLIFPARQSASPSHPRQAVPAQAGDHHDMDADPELRSPIHPTFSPAADARPQSCPQACDGVGVDEPQQTRSLSPSCLMLSRRPHHPARDSVFLADLPNELLLHILGYLDVNDLLSTSRTNHHLRHLSLSPILHAYRLRHTRAILPPLLSSPSRPSLAELIARSIFLTHTSVVSRRLARSLVSIRLSRRLASRPSAEALVERSVLPPECVPGMSMVQVAPALVAKRRAIEKEKVKDGLRKWVEGVWKGEVRQREEGVKRWEESRGVGRVWRLRRFWERVSRGDGAGRR